MLKFKDLHIGFKGKSKQEDTLLFKTAHQSFEAGDFVALIGANGAGKTTLFNTVLGLHKALKGNVLIEGQPLKEISREEKVKFLSYVPSKFSGIEHLTTYDLIALGRSPYTNILNRLTENDHQRIKEVIQQLDLTSLKDKDTLSLSDGERQIAMIGKALAQDSKLMVLDEPTAFLDYNNKRKIMYLLHDLAKKNKQLIFISSHDIELCFDYCNRIIAIDSHAKELIHFDTPFDKNEVIKSVFGG